MIVVLPTSVAVILAVVGVVLWIAEQPGRARKRRAARAARARLHADLTAPPPAAAQLPYGLSGAPGDETDETPPA